MILEQLDVKDPDHLTRGPRAWRSADRSRQGKKPEFEMSLSKQH
jgi:hypothetical protein